MVDELELPTPEELDLPEPDEISLMGGEADMPINQPEVEKMSAEEAALTNFDPLFLNPLTAGAGAALGHATSEEGAKPDEIDAQIVKSQTVADKLQGQGKVEQYQKMLANIEDLKKLKDPSYKETYYEGKEAFGEQEDKAMRDQPAASIASMVGSGFITPLPGATLAKVAKAGGKLAKVAKTASKVLPNLGDVKKLQKLTKQIAKAEKLGLTLSAKKLQKQQKLTALLGSVKEGGKIGAMQAASRGDAKLLDGDVEGFISDTMTGTGLGAGLGGAFTATTQLGANLLSKTPFMKNLKTSYTLGTKGKNIDPDYTAQDKINLAKELISDFDTKLKSTGKDIQKFYQEFSEAGYALNTREDLEKIESIIMKMEPSSRSEYEPIIKTLKDFLHGGKSHDKAFAKLEKDILLKTIKDNPIEQAKLRIEKKDLRDAIKKQYDTIDIDDMGQITAKDALPEGSESVKAVGSKKTVQEITKDGISSKQVFEAADTTPFQPSKIQRAVDEQSGKQVTYYKDLGTGKVNAIVDDIKQAGLDPESLTLQKAKELRDALKKHIKNKEVDGQLKATLIDAKNNLQDKLVTSIKNETDKTNLRELNKIYSSLKEIKGVTGTDKNSTVDALRSMTQFITGSNGKGDQIAMNEFVKQVKKVDPKLATKIMEEVTELRSRYDIGKVSSEVRASTGLVSEIKGGMVGFINKAMGSLTHLVYQGSNAVGRGQRGIILPLKTAAASGKKSLANVTLTITESSPQQIRGLIEQIKSSGSKANSSFLKPLERALTSNQRTKQAVMFGLAQQPAFIEMVNKLSLEESKENKDE